MINEKEMGGPLRFRVWVTRGGYFTLAERMSRKARYSVGATTLLSFYVVVLSLVILVFPEKISEVSSKWITTSSLIISIFIIIITLMENSKGYALNAEYAGQSARELAFLFNQMEEMEECDPESNDLAHIKKYNDILSQARIGHANIDYHGFQLTHPGEFKLTKWKWLGVLALYTIEAVLEYWPYALMVLGPLAPTIWVVSLIVNGVAH